MKREKMKGTITISRPHGSHGPEQVSIEVTDELSGTRVLTAKIPVEEFADVLFGSAHTPCEFDLYPDLVGLKREHKEELVPFNGGYYPAQDRAEVAAKAFAPFEVDGWEGRADDLFNHHRQGGGWSRVSFVRYVEPETTS